MNDASGGNSSGLNSPERRLDFFFSPKSDDDDDGRKRRRTSDSGERPAVGECQTGTLASSSNGDDVDNHCGDLPRT